MEDESFIYTIYRGLSRAVLDYLKSSHISGLKSAYYWWERNSFGYLCISRKAGRSSIFKAIIK